MRCRPPCAQTHLYTTVPQDDGTPHAADIIPQEAIQSLHKERQARVSVYTEGRARLAWNNGPARSITGRCSPQMVQRHNRSGTGGEAYIRSMGTSGASCK